MERELNLGELLEIEKKQKEKFPFVYASSDRVYLSYDGHKKVFKVFLNESSPLIASKDKRKEFEDTSDRQIGWYNDKIEEAKDKKEGAEIANKEYPWRFSAGGALVIDGNTKKVYTILRDSGAPSFPGYLTLASGLSTNYDEIINPERVAFREGLEELLFTKEGEILVPKVYGNEIFNEYAHKESEKHKDKFYHGYGIREMKTVIDNSLNIDIINVFYDGEKVTENKGIIVLDPKTKGIDLIKIWPVYPERFYGIEDGEKPFNINREIKLFHLHELFKEKLTPVLKRAAEVLKEKGF